MLHVFAHAVNRGTRLPMDGVSVFTSIRTVIATVAAGVRVSKNDIRDRRPPDGVFLPTLHGC
ncbi:hypothetical protein GCM10007416_33510 [Kroppenstedtia guangzhouensis]|uniref:Uncharacterized protein n=1 Tax=Kroppenstedtia guangzhouensis TaxID=1274356 RepID=A0ABQ1H4R3_9BACL|nr:hypothetical protein [Kroppenstedtia guangzhouensis]GGA57567.1 hypothetical protein GCM10007416_33510 [Kroppenstedtia guangzhouensis]